MLPIVCGKRKEKKRKKKLPSPLHCPLPAPEQVCRERLRTKKGKKRLTTPVKERRRLLKKMQSSKSSHYPNPHAPPHPTHPKRQKGKRQKADIIMPLSWQAGSKCCHTIYHDWHDQLHQPLLIHQSNFQSALQIQTFRQTREPG